MAEARALFDHAPAARAEPAVATVPKYPLGVARGQVAATYIVAEAEDGLVIVDQHAAHERLVLERMRAAREGGTIARQALLMPEVVELDETDCDRLEAAADELGGLGLEIERFGPTAVLVRATPARARQDRRPAAAQRPGRGTGRTRQRASRCRKSSTMSRRPSPATARCGQGGCFRSPK